MRDVDKNEPPHRRLIESEWRVSRARSELWKFRRQTHRVAHVCSAGRGDARVYGQFLEVQQKSPPQRVAAPAAHNHHHPMAERNFQLHVEPKDKLVFSGDLSQEITIPLRITNKSDSRQAFKVKCSRNDLFRIKPSTGVLDFGQQAVCLITFKPNKEYTPISGRHHFGIYHIPAPEGSTCTGAWSEHYGPPQGDYRIKVFFEEKK